jgi:hypothetical protein
MVDPLMSSSANDSDRRSAFFPTDRNAQAVLWSSLIVGGALFVLNARLPLSRNALCYAKAALGIIQHRYNAIPIAHDFGWTSGKPILFPWLSAPFVRVLGLNVGMVAASFVGTALFIWVMSLTIQRLITRTGLDPSIAPLALVLSAGNPLVLYQFWSAYPDALVAALVLTAMLLTDTIAAEPQRDTRWHIVGLGAVIDLAIHAKLYGAILGLTCPLYLFMHGRALVTRSTHRAAKLAILAVVFGALALTLLLAKLNMNPILDLAPEEPMAGGYSEYLRGLLNPSSGLLYASLDMMRFALLINFHIALLFLLTRRAWWAWRPAPTMFIAIYMLGLITFGGTSYNMRYFLPAFPFVGLALAAGAMTVPRVLRNGVLTLYGVAAVSLVLNFNVESAQYALRPLMDHVLPAKKGMFGVLDNLRLAKQLQVRQEMEAINAGVPPAHTLYWVSNYYKTATHGVAEHLGMKSGMDVRYTLSADQIPPSGTPVFVAGYTADGPMVTLRRVPAWAAPQRVGYGLFRFDPVQADLIALSGDRATDADPIRLRANVRAGEGIHVTSVDFTEGSTVLGTTSAAPFELVLAHAAAGRHQVSARVTYGAGDVLLSEPIVLYVDSGSSSQSQDGR